MPGRGAQGDSDDFATPTVVMSPQDALRSVIGISLVAMAAAIGLQSTPGELLRLFTRPALLLRAILAVNVIVPLAAVAVIALLPLLPIVKAGIILMAASPAAPFVPGNAEKAGAARGGAFALYTALVLVAVVAVPITVALLSRAYGIDVALPPLLMAKRFGAQVLGPMAAGLAIHRLAPRPAERIGAVATRAATILLLAAAAPIVVMAWPQVWALVGNGTALAIALVCLVALAAGHLLGGPEPGWRGALAMAAVYRHPGVAMAIAGAAQSDRGVTAAILAFALVGLVMGLTYRAWLGRRPPVELA